MIAQNTPLYAVPDDGAYNVGLVIGWHQPDARSAPRPFVVPLDWTTGASPAAEPAGRKFAFFVDLAAAEDYVDAWRGIPS